MKADKTVFACYYDWYTAAKSWKKVSHIPVMPRYHSMKESVIRRHLQWAGQAGIDVMAVTWWGKQKYAGGERSDDCFHRLMDVAQSVGSPVRFCVYYETAPGWKHNDPRSIAKDFLYILERHGSHPRYFRSGGKPVIIIYNRAMDQLTPAEWRTVIRTVKAKRDAILVAEGYNFTEDTIRMFDAFHYYNPGLHSDYGGYRLLTDRCRVALCRRHGLIPTLTIVPGFDSHNLGRNYVIQDRQNGRVYQRVWSYALKSGVPWVFITSFNEWYEGSEIEPSREFGNQYLKLTAKMTRVFKSGSARQRDIICRKWAGQAPGERLKTIGKIKCPCLAVNPRNSRELSWPKPAVTSFYRINGDRAVSRTTVQLGYDKRQLHVRFTCMEPGMRELTSVSKDKTNNLFADDSVEIFVIASNGGNDFFQFIADAAGRLFCRRSRHQVWKGLWKARVERTEDRWIVEAAIPFSTIGKKPRAGDVWRMNFCRSRAKKSRWPQELCSAFPLFGDYFIPERFGRVVFQRPEKA